MTKYLIFMPAARFEVIEAHDCYEKEKAGLGAQFRAEIDHQAERIVEHPLHFPRMLADVHRAMLTVLSGIAQFEREMMLERQREGIAKCKAAGRYRGRKPVALESQEEALRLAALGLTKANIAQKLSLGEATVYRILAAAKAKKA